MKRDADADRPGEARQQRTIETKRGSAEDTSSKAPAPSCIASVI
jgi:hypothetical protein